MKVKQWLTRVLIIAMLMQTIILVFHGQSVFAATKSLPLITGITYSSDWDCFIAVGNTFATGTNMPGAVMTSTDGLTWTVRNGPAITIGLGSYNTYNSSYQALVWGNKQAVALQNLATGGNVLVTNADLSSWATYATKNTSGTTIYLAAICWDALTQKYYAVDSTTGNDLLYYTSDPTATNAWTPITLTYPISGKLMWIASNNYGKIVAMAPNSLTIMITAPNSTTAPAQSGKASGPMTVAYGGKGLIYDGKADGTGRFIGSNLKDAALYYLTNLGNTSAPLPSWSKISADASLPSPWTGTNSNTGGNSNDSYWAIGSNGTDIIALPQGMNTSATPTGIALSYVNQATAATTNVMPATMDSTNLSNLFSNTLWGTAYQTRCNMMAARPNGVFVAAISQTNGGAYYNSPSNYSPGNNSFVVINNVESPAATATLHSYPSYTGYDNTAVAALDYTLNSSNPIYVKGSSATYTSAATVKDTRGATLTGKTINWSIPNAPAGVSVNSTTGAVTVVSTATVGNSFVLQAASSDQPSVIRKQTFTLLQELSPQLPVATSLTISGYTLNPKPGDILTASYNYSDGNGDAENGTIYRWLESSEPAFGSYSVAKEGTTTQANAATDTTYTITPSDLNKYLKLEITPKNLVTPTTGTAVTTTATPQILSERYAFNEDFEGYTAGTTNGVATVNGWSVPSGKTFTITAANSGDANTSKFISTTDASKTFTATNNNNGKVIVDLRVKTPATLDSSWTKTISTKSSAGYLTSFYIQNNFMKCYYGYLTSDSAGNIPMLDTTTTLTPNTWYYIRQVMDFSTKKVTLYYGTTLSNLQVWKTDVTTSTRDMGYTGTAPNLVAPTSISSFRVTGGLAVDDLKVYYPPIFNEDFEGFKTASTMSQMQVYANGSESTGGKDYATNAVLYDDGSNKALKFSYTSADGTNNGIGAPASVNNIYTQKNLIPILGIAVMEARVKLHATANNYALGLTYANDLVEFGLDGVYAYNDTVKGSKLKSTISGSTDFVAVQDKWYELKVVMNTTTSAISGYAAESYDFYVDGIKLVNQNKLNNYAATDYATVSSNIRLCSKMAYYGAEYPTATQGDIYVDNWLIYAVDSTYITALNSSLNAETSATNAAASNGNTFAAFEDIRSARALVSQLPTGSYAKINLNNDIYRSTAICLATEMNLANIPQSYMSIPGAIELNSAFSKADYTGFLKSYSKYLIYKLRGINFGQFFLHDTWIDTNKMAYADIMVTNDGTGYVTDKYSINGDPSQTHNMQWVLPGTSDPSYGDDYASFYNFIPLIAAYWSKGTNIYKDKWFEVANNFHCNQYNQLQSSSTFKDANSYPFTDYHSSYACNWDWKSAISSLRQGNRIEAVIKSLAIIAKSLTTQKATHWDNIFDVKTDTITQTQLDTIPFLELTNIVTSIIKKYPSAMISRYISAGATPNQRFAGLEGIAMISHVFDEFSDTVNTTSPSTETGLTDYANTVFYKDGAMLEQSFNYNFGDKDKIDNLNLLYQDATVKPTWLSQLNTVSDNFTKMVTGFANPLGQLPRLASFTPSESPAFWLNSASVNTWKATAANSGVEFLQNTTPGYTSVAFPYAGYYAMRSGWDMQNDIYLAFVNARRAMGHLSGNSNAVDITAFGRKMIVSGGTPWYGVDFAPDSQKSEFNQFDKYFAEYSSYKNSTVLVNDKNQSPFYKTYWNMLQTTSTDTIQSRWHSSDNFDFTEGLWDGGYNLAGTNYPSTANIDSSVTHQRQVLFVKTAKMWILNDTMHANTVNSTAYSQVWNFSPYDTGKNPGVGYSQSQVICDQTNNTIYTNDISGPNLWMYNFAGKAFTYTPYYGYKGSPQYIGWYSRGFFGEMIPRVDVHVKWTDAAITNISDRTDKPMVTAIIPTQNTVTRVLSKTDLSSTQNGGASGFELKTTDNITVSYLTVPTVKTLTLQGITSNAKLLEVTKKDSEAVYRGVVLGCTRFSIGDTVIPVTIPDFEFEVQDGIITNIIPIKIPEGFTWLGQTQSDNTPAYGRGQGIDATFKYVKGGAAPQQNITYTGLIQGVINATAEITNYDASTKQMQIIMALYESNQLKQVVLKPLQSIFGKSKGLYDIQLNVPEVGGTSAVKIFLFDGIGSIRPWTKPSVFNNKGITAN